MSCAPPRNGLSYQNSQRDWHVFEYIYKRLHQKLLGQQNFACRFRPNIRAGRVLLLDSSTVTLCLNLFKWAHYSEEKGAIKLHTLFAFNDFLPVDVHVSDGKESDNMGAYHLVPSERSIIVADRGYDDSELRKEWDSRGGTFVVRLRRDIKFDRLADVEQPSDREQDILVDEAIRLTGDDTSRQYSRPLRRVVVYRPYDSSRRKKTPEDGVSEPPEHTIELVTNNTAWDAETMSALDKARWQIESFFKLIKQHLRMKTFIGTNKNAVMSQIRAAMPAMLLLKYLQSRSTQDWHMANLVTFVRIHLMNYVDLWKWPEHPFEASLSPPNFSYE